MDLFEKNGNCIYILNVLKKYTDEEHIISVAEIQRKVKEIYDVDIDPRTIRRNINLLKYKLNYDISTREDNNKGYYISRDPETDFEAGEIRAIIDTFNYSNFIAPSIAKGIIEKCKNLQNVYENEKLKDYQIYVPDNKTQNKEVIKNMEDISEAILNNNKISFEYWKYRLNDKLEKQISSTPTVSPYAIVYNKQEFYLICLKDEKEELSHYRIDKMKSVKVIKDSKVERKTKKEIRDFALSAVEMFGGETAKITVICNNILLDEVIERFGKDVKISKIDDKSFQLTVEANLMGFKFWVMRNMDLVTVLKPEILRAEIKEIAEKAYKNHK